MKSTIRYSIWNRRFSWADGFVFIRTIVQRRGFDQKGDLIYGIIRVNPSKTLEVTSLDELIQVLSKLASFDSFMSQTKFVHATKQKGGSLGSTLLHIDLNVSADVAVAIGSNDYDIVEGIHNEIKEHFRLSNPQLPTPERPLYLQPTVFVGRHFDKVGDEAFRALEPFLTLLGLDVKQGAEYSSQDIPEKVIDRIDSQDIFLAVITGSRNHAWLNAEPAYAKAKGKYIILLVEDDARYDPTILGRDLEQIRFAPSAIEKSFVPLLGEFRNIRIKGL